MVVDSSDRDLPARQLHALFNLHSNLNVNKTLINMQLAATHIAYMVQKQTEAHVCRFSVPSLCYSTIFYRLFLISLEHFKKSRTQF